MQVFQQVGMIFFVRSFKVKRMIMFQRDSLSGVFQSSVMVYVCTQCIVGVFGISYNFYRVQQACQLQYVNLRTCYKNENVITRQLFQCVPNEQKSQNDVEN
eukprot:TRINITY_DN5557_c0_g1_i10.p3 TRINITY_DN5557_c0_g1~~TRINITY_DN5557_c0_g1_i10.p3  ORF type:complete len:101 (-),score=1.61 TRINITY_DN5557_c0_g1_i10:344-646(-)